MFFIMESKISRKPKRTISNLKWDWNIFKIRYNLWKISFILKTLKLRILFNPKIILLRIKGGLHKIGRKFFKVSRMFNNLKWKVKQYIWDRKYSRVQDMGNYHI